MNINELTNYKATAITYSTWSVQFGKAVEIVDEGSPLRIRDFHIIEKFRVVTVEKDGDRVAVKMKDGKKIVLNVVRDK